MSESATAPAPDRVVSIDALRGFDMFWITGGREILLGAVALFTGGVPVWLDYQLRHPAWTGFSAWDLIMPLFLFITGSAMPFSFSRKKRGHAAIYRRLARRVVLLWILGMIAQGNLLSCIAGMDFSTLRLYSNTLQAIASGYVIAALALMHLHKTGQAILCAALLLIYWALMALVPVPGHGAGVFTPDGNLAIHIDKLLLGRFQDGTTYTWILSSISFGGTVLLGVFGGHILRSAAKPAQKFGMLLAAGFLCLALGALWDLAFPIIKHIWSSSMALWAAGWCYLLLAFFYALCDWAGWRKWAFPFVIIGANAILAYMVGEKIIEFGLHLANSALGETRVTDGLGALLAFAIMWTALFILYRKRWFLRV